MKVLLTGGEGYIGTVLGPLLMERGHDVTVYDTGYPPGRLALRRGRRCASLAQARHPSSPSPADLEGFDAIIHLADLSNDPVGELNPELTFDINHRSTVRFAEMAKAAGVERFVYSSSCSVYGASGADER